MMFTQILLIVVLNKPNMRKTKQIKSVPTGRLSEWLMIKKQLWEKLPEA